MDLAKKTPYPKAIDESANESKDNKYFITLYKADDDFGGDVIRVFDEFDKKKIEGIFTAHTRKMEEGDELEFSKGLGDVILTVEKKDGKIMTQVTKGSKTYYKPFRGFK